MLLLREPLLTTVIKVDWFLFVFSQMIIKKKSRDLKTSVTASYLFRSRPSVSVKCPNFKTLTWLSLLV